MSRYPLHLLTTAVVAVGSLLAFNGPSALAGYTVQTGSNTVINNDTSPAGGSIGDSFSIGLDLGSTNLFSTDVTPAGTFASYTPDTPFDPQITGSDLNLYRYNLTGTITSVAANVATYSGAYLIFYDQNSNGEPDDSLFVSEGTLAATATFDPLTGETAQFLGTLTQTQGPNNPNFGDLSYGGNDVILTGMYLDDTAPGPSQTGALTATFRQNAPAGVPEPTSLALAGLGLAGLATLRRRRQA